MSSEAEVEVSVLSMVSISDLCCANCGITEVDEIKLKKCDGCDLVKYCSDKCMDDHREQHEEECKKRAQQLHDEELFTQPDSCHRGECPICFIPLPINPQKSIMKACCSKSICEGCLHANYMSGNFNCPFCREPVPKHGEEEKRMMERVKANDPAAICQVGAERSNEGDHVSAVEYWIKAAELGDVEAHYYLGDRYYNGEGVVEDVEKAVYHYEKAAIRGHPTARQKLAYNEEWDNGNIERSVKHLIIAAKLGDEKSMKALWKHFSAGNITKEDLDATLRAHHAAIDATKSPEREAAEAFYDKSKF
jgi:hypothetical protein